MTVAVVVSAVDPAAHCRALEDGALLLVPETPLNLTTEQRAALLRCERVGASHKNIAYEPARGRLSGAPSGDDHDLLRDALMAYAEQMTALLVRLLSPYAQAWRVDATSFRPQEEAGRVLPWRSRNDLLHVDAFPARPTNGARILRVFTNLHPSEARRWMTTRPFDELARHGLGDAPRPPRLAPARLRRWLAARAPATLMPLLRRSPYDAAMLRLHDRLKADAAFQANGETTEHVFAPGASWIAFTDAVAHAVISGRCALEQTYVLPVEAMLVPEKAPLHTLERLYGAGLADPG